MESYNITSDLSQVQIMAGHLHAFCNQHKVDAAVSSQLELILVEVLNNVIEHSYRNQSGNPIEACFDKKDDDIHLVISDQGHPVPLEVQQMDTVLPDIEELPEGGWGLCLINALSDDVQFTSDNGTNTVRLIKQAS